MAKNLVKSDSDSDTSDNESAKETSLESDSDSEPELNQTQTTKKPLSSSTPAAAKKPVHQSAPKPAQQPSPTSSESGSDSDSDSDPKDSPIPTQAKEPPQNGARKSKTKPAAADPVTPTRSTAQKRPADETESKAAKKSKKKAEPDTPKKSTFQRLWTEGDELVILKGMIDYRDKKNADPTADGDAFHEFIKKNLGTKDFVTSQLLDKIKRTKKKYENLKIKEEKMDGKEMTFSKPREQKFYELSKRVWGNTNKDEAVKKEASKRTVVVAVKEDAAAKEDKFLAELANRMGVNVDDRVLSIGVEMFENGKGDSAGEKEWRKLRLEEMQANLRLWEVKTAQARLVVDCLMSQGK